MSSALSATSLEWKAAETLRVLALTPRSMATLTAAFTAAPIVGKLVPRIGPMLGVRPDATRDVDISDLRNLIEGRR